MWNYKDLGAPKLRQSYTRVTTQPYNFAYYKSKYHLYSSSFSTRLGRSLRGRIKLRLLRQLSILRNTNQYKQPLRKPTKHFLRARYIRPTTSDVSLITLPRHKHIGGSLSSPILSSVQLTWLLEHTAQVMTTLYITNTFVLNSSRVFIYKPSHHLFKTSQLPSVLNKILASAVQGEWSLLPVPKPDYLTRNISYPLNLTNLARYNVPSQSYSKPPSGVGKALGYQGYNSGVSVTIFNKSKFYNSIQAYLFYRNSLKKKFTVSKSASLIISFETPETRLTTLPIFLELKYYSFGRGLKSIKYSTRGSDLHNHLNDYISNFLNPIYSSSLVA